MVRTIFNDSVRLDTILDCQRAIRMALQEHKKGFDVQQYKLFR